jgi:hypothetical protein
LRKIFQLSDKIKALALSQWAAIGAPAGSSPRILACSDTTASSSADACGMLSRRMGKLRMPVPRGSRDAGARSWRVTGRWSVARPPAGRIFEEEEGKRWRKEEESSQRSKRAPELAEGLQWVNVQALGLASRQRSRKSKASITPRSSCAPEEREEEEDNPW